MIRKVPIIGPSATLKEIISSAVCAFRTSCKGEFEDVLSVNSGLRYIYTTSSGIAAFYLILKSLAKVSDRDEVILPAYTAGSLVVAIRKAGLKCVLCDISMEDFNADADLMLQASGSRTLAAVPVHMFGVPMTKIGYLKERLPSDILVLEDCCQSMGSRITQESVGKFGDVSFFSFNRGKNLPVCSGGFIATNNEDMDRCINDAIKRYSHSVSGVSIASVARACVFSLGMNPWLFGCMHLLASIFRENAPPGDFEVTGLGSFEKALALCLIKRNDELARKRRDNGMYLYNALKPVEQISLPKISRSERVVFNRFTVLFNEASTVSTVMKRLWEAGIESSRMYLRPLHHMFDLGYGQGDFPKAVSFAQRLLTLPVHPMVSRRDLDKIIDVIKGVCR